MENKPTPDPLPVEVPGDVADVEGLEIEAGPPNSGAVVPPNTGVVLPAVPELLPKTGAVLPVGAEVPPNTGVPLPANSGEAVVAPANGDVVGVPPNNAKIKICF